MDKGDRNTLVQQIFDEYCEESSPNFVQMKPELLLGIKTKMKEMEMELNDELEYGIYMRKKKAEKIHKEKNKVKYDSLGRYIGDDKDVFDLDDKASVFHFVEEELPDEYEEVEPYAMAKYTILVPRDFGDAAQVAQQLHAMGEHSPVLAVPQRGTKPGGVIGGRMRSRVFTAQRGTKPGVISGSVPGVTTRRRTRTAEERGVDDWLIGGVDRK